MRKQLLFIFLTITVLAACKKSDDDNLFGASPDTRLNDTLNKYQKILSGAEHGWKGLVLPDGLDHGVFAFYFKFNDSNRVQMFADYDSVSSITMKESSYRLKALQQPSLLFDSYSYIHILSDPDAAVNGGVYGEGLYSDFEFSIDGMSGDTMKLTGRFHGSKAMIIKATAEEEAAYYGKQSNRLIDNIDKYLTYFKRLTTGGVNYDIAFNIFTRSAKFSWIDESGAEHVEITGFYYTPDGVAFYPAVNGSITAFNNVTWSPSTTTLSFTVNGSAGTIKEIAKPTVIDKTAPKAWYNAVIGSYWQSVTGFHVNGVDDAYGIQTLPNYYLLLFYPQFGTSSGINYDLLSFVTYDGVTQPSIEYGPAFSAPNYTTDGRIVFPYLGDLGTYPDDATPIINTITKISESTGFYLVRTGSATYDMVSAKDGKAWISWN
ncbi:SH3 domain-containing protein [Chitinophaga sp. YR573]|uniref:DUF4302 domain-containing protein n=1 Tax=Chitinophaga sp. YR573 TaxID=1881040 RepID=UPI0008C57199|nr:DUF4302 domain-containing protein [Chitinophaga sp. YR573]SEW20574.1 SH3 domain-containing protein [Chitinophaga sp. YR573]